jgi:O-antigen/teichoic acid export membrane protein
VGAVSQFVVGVVLARLLAPSDFGLISLAFVVLGLAGSVGDLGMSDALVQRKHLTDRHLRTAFTFSVALGVALAAALAVLAPLGARLTGEPRVTPVVRWLSLNFAVQGTAVVAGALLRRRLDYKRRFVISTSSYVAGYAAVATTLALLGYGVWSLVWGGLTQTVLLAAGNLIASPHPVRWLVARSELGELLHFGVGASLGDWMNYLARNGDNFVVGREFGAESLGLYARAYSLMNLPFTYAASVMSAVLFPAMSRLQDDLGRLRRAFLLMTRLTAAISAPVMATMTVAAPHLIVALYGPRWAGAIPPLQVLCVFGYFRAVYHVGGVVAQSAGRIYGELANQILYAALVLTGALIGAQFGMPFVAAGVGLAITAMFLATSRLALRATHTSWRVYLRCQVDSLVIGLTTGGLTLLARLSLERYGMPDAVVAVVLVAIGGMAAAVGTAWTLSERDFQPLIIHLPRLVTWCVDPVRQFREAFE